MKASRMATIAIMSLMAVGISTSFAHSLEPPVNKMAGAEAAVRRVSDQEVEAFTRNDPKAMGQLWSDDIVVTNPLNKFVTKQQVLGLVQSGILVITSYDRQIEYLRVYGDTVIVAGNETVLWGGKMPNAGKTEHLRFTAVWMQQAGRWQEVARHANVVPQS
jgi:ketosteroid isomerase-like protein